MTNQLKVGQGITWTHVARRGKCLRCGTVEATEGDMVTIRRPSGECVTIKLKLDQRVGFVEVAK